MAFIDDAYNIVVEVRSIIAPGASGWDVHGAEEYGLREIIVQAETNLSIDPFSEYGLELNDYVYREVTSQLPAAPHSYDNREALATPGQMNVALANTEDNLAAGG